MGIFFCYFLSGFSALLYQIAFARVLIRLLGSTTLAVTCILSFYLLGLALGSLSFGPIADRSYKPLKLYAWLELGAALGGALFLLLSSPSLMESAFSYGFFGVSVSSVRYIYSAIAVIVPTFFIGGTFTVLSKYLTGKAILSKEGEEFLASPSIVLLYSINLLGAVFGIVCGGFYIIPHLGLIKSIGTAAGLNVFVFLIAIFLSRGKQASFANDSHRIAVENGPSIGLPIALFLVFISGAISLALEVVYTRFFSLVLGSSTYAITTVVAAFLLGLGLGSLLVFWLTNYLRNQRILIPALLVFAGAFSAIALWSELWLVGELPEALLQLQAFLNQSFFSSQFVAYIGARVIIAVFSVGLPALAVGMIFPLTMIAYRSDMHVRVKEIAILYSVSTFGCIFGAWFAGLYLIPWLGRITDSGMQSTMEILALTLLVMAIVCCLCSSHKNLKVPVFVFLSVLGGSMVFNKPTWDKALMSSGIAFLSPKNMGQIKFYREGITSTVTVGTEPGVNVDYLKNDGRVQAAVPIDYTKSAPTSDLSTHLLLGLLPYLCSPKDLHDVLIIGYGSGTTAGALSSINKVHSETVAEIEPAVYAAGKYFSSLPEINPQSANVHLLSIDARNFLYTTSKQFDAIVSQPAEPWVNVASDLYTIEFWRLARSHLSCQGVFCQWVQLYGITPDYLRILLRSFKEVFPASFVFHPERGGEILLLGYCDPNLDLNSLELNAIGRMKENSIKPLLKFIGITKSADFLNSFVATPKDLDILCQYKCKDHDRDLLSTDDNLLFEYALPKELYHEGDLISQNLALFTACSKNLKH